jgi:hypothetical protein
MLKKMHLNEDVLYLSTSLVIIFCSLDGGKVQMVFTSGWIRN